MAVLGVVAVVILLCIVAALRAMGRMNTGEFNFRGRNRGAVDRREPKPRAPGLN